MVKNSTETWRRYGTVEVSRDERGRFLHWEIISIISRKQVSVYQNVYTRRGVESRRWQLYSRNGMILQRGVITAIHYPPKIRFLTIDAEKLLSNPYQYIDPEARWIGRPEVGY